MWTLWVDVMSLPLLISTLFIVTESLSWTERILIWLVEEASLYWASCLHFLTAQMINGLPPPDTSVCSEDLNSRLHAVQQVFYPLSYLPRTANSFKATKCCLKLLCSRSVLLTWFFSFVLVHYHVISWELIFFTWINILILVSFLLINCCSTWTSELLKQAW